jgi:hypothetical protein
MFRFYWLVSTFVLAGLADLTGLPIEAAELVIFGGVFSWLFAEVCVRLEGEVE